MLVDAFTGPTRINYLAGAFGTAVAYFAACGRATGKGPVIFDRRVRGEAGGPSSGWLRPRRGDSVAFR